MPDGSIYGLLHRECERLFPDEMFADLFTDVGRRSVPPMIVAVVMVLQRIEGCSDREAVERFCFDARWKYAAGGLDFDYPGFVHTVLVDMRARLAASAGPNRIFDAVLEVASAAGLVGRRRVLDSTPIYDAVATMDTVTLVRSAIRGLLKAADAELERALRAVLTREDDYLGAGKPVCDYDDPAARAEMVDALARDGAALLGVLDGRELDEAVEQAGALLATVLGQDLDRDEAGVFRIARRVARDRVISTVDPEARHGHKTAARGFDGYKGHIGVDPDSEIITATAVGAGNAGDAAAAEELIGDLLEEPHYRCRRRDRHGPPRLHRRHHATAAAVDAGDDLPGGHTTVAAPAGVRPDSGAGSPNAATTPLPGRRDVAARGTPPPPTPTAGALRRTGRVCTATTLTAPANSRIGWIGPGSSQSARPSRPWPPAAASPRTGSTSIWTPKRSAVRPGTPRRSSGTGTGPVPPRSARCARGVRCVSSAPPRGPGGRSASASTKGRWPRPGPGNGSLAGWPTTGPPDRRWNASSGT